MNYYVKFNENRLKSILVYHLWKKKYFINIDHAHRTPPIQTETIFGCKNWTITSNLMKIDWKAYLCTTFEKKIFHQHWPRPSHTTDTNRNYFWEFVEISAKVAIILKFWCSGATLKIFFKIFFLIFAFIKISNYISSRVKLFQIKKKTDLSTPP